MNDTRRSNQAAGWLSAGGRESAIAAPEDFAAFFDRCHRIVFRYVYGLGGGPLQNAEDLTAEAFTRAWRARKGFHGDDGAALGWLMHIARNLVIDDARRRSRQTEAPLGEADTLLSKEAAPEAAAIAKEEGRILMGLIQALPDQAREMVVLRYLVGWRVNQIAEYLGISENSVSVGIRRSLERVQRQWPTG